MPMSPAGADKPASVRFAAMTLDPRTPVIVGVGQLTRHPGGGDGSWALTAPEPVDMMAEALRQAARDSGAGADLLARAQRIAVVRLMCWSYSNPALLLAERLGAAPADLVLSGTGGNTPQALVHEAAADIAAGRLDVALVSGAEAMYTRRVLGRSGAEPGWTRQAEDTPAPRTFGHDRAGTSEAEAAVGLMLPVQVYPVFENALRGASGSSLEEHQRRIAQLWATFSRVAAANPYAWSRTSKSAEEIMTVAPDNRMVGFPYPKYLNSNIQVDQAAGFIIASVEAARSAGVPEDRWVFPRAGAEANDHWFISERDQLHSSPAIRLAGNKTFALDGTAIEEVAHVDLYSCFPSAVQLGAAALGLPLDDPDLPLTVTGGLQFGGGPGNNYVTHSIAAMCERLRRDPGSLGLVTALGWYATKHAVGLYSSEPPPNGFRWENVQQAVDALPSRSATTEAEAAADIESYVVMHDRDGAPARATVTALLPDGTRALAATEDTDEMAELVSAEGVGRRVDLRPGGRARLA
jgi:acetyl-CoA C-acetyltransferase